MKLLKQEHWGMLMPYLRKIQHFKSKKLLHQGIVNGSIANFFAILLQYNSKHRIVLFTVLQKKNIYIFYSSYFTRNFSLIPLIFSILFSLFLLCFSICSLLSEASSPKFLTHLRNFSPISHGLSLIAPVLGFGFLRLRLDQRGSASWVWIVGLGSVGLKWWIC